MGPSSGGGRRFKSTDCQEGWGPAAQMGTPVCISVMKAAKVRPECHRFLGKYVFKEFLVLGVTEEDRQE